MAHQNRECAGLKKDLNQEILKMVALLIQMIYKKDTLDRF